MEELYGTLICDCLHHWWQKISSSSENCANTLRDEFLKSNFETRKSNVNESILPYTSDFSRESKILVYCYVENKKDVLLEIIGHDAVKCNNMIFDEMKENYQTVSANPSKHGIQLSLSGFATPTKIIELEGDVSLLFKAPFKDDEKMSMSLHEYTERLMKTFNGQCLRFIDNK